MEDYSPGPEETQFHICKQKALCKVWKKLTATEINLRKYTSLVMKLKEGLQSVM